jgi:peptidoglycan/xylan/chitin deacetylase (PgdA/CDA1 family)
MSGTDVNVLRVARFPRDATCAITTSWDDNSADNMEVSKILDGVGLKGTFYVDPAGPYVDPLTDSQLCELAKTHEVGSHTWSHAHLKTCDRQRLQQELVDSREYLERVTRRPVLGVAYPFGEYSPAAAAVVQECGYFFARTIEEGHVEFPPSNPYEWGISVYALNRPQLTPRKLLSKTTLKKLVSKRVRPYYRNLSTQWYDLALKLFERARLTSGVLHIFGHARELMQPVLGEQFLQVCRHISRRPGVWYATNSLLFMNELVRKNVRITAAHDNMQTIFQVQTSPDVGDLTRITPIPLRFSAPEWPSRFRIQVKTGNSGRFDIGEDEGHVWIDVFDSEAQVQVAYS